MRVAPRAAQEARRHRLIAQLRLPSRERRRERRVVVNVLFGAEGLALGLGAGRSVRSLRVHGKERCSSIHEAKKRSWPENTGRNHHREGGEEEEEQRA